MAYKGRVIFKQFFICKSNFPDNKSALWVSRYAFKTRNKHGLVQCVPSLVKEYYLLYGLPSDIQEKGLGTLRESDLVGCFQAVSKTSCKVERNNKV